MVDEKQDSPQSFLVSDDLGEYRMYLPGAAADHIQKVIATSGKPYEDGLLEATRQWIPKPVVVADVGSNIGNHSVYWARHGHYVHMFEPQQQLLDISQRNVELNGLQSRTRLHAYALGSEEAHARMSEPDPSNLGAGRIIKDQEGEVRVKRLDDVGLDSLGLLKLDVEGMEQEVLSGALDTLAKHRPIVLIETLEGEALESILRSLNPLEYVHWGMHNSTPTHMFIPSERLSTEQLVERAARAASGELFADGEKKRNVETLREIRSRYRKAMQNEKRLKVRMVHLESQQSGDLSHIDSATQIVEELTVAIDEQRAQIAQLARDEAAASSKLSVLSEANEMHLRELESLRSDRGELLQQVDNHKRDLELLDEHTRVTYASLEQVRSDYERVLVEHEKVLREFQALSLARDNEANLKREFKRLVDSQSSEIADLKAQVSEAVSARYKERQTRRNVSEKFKDRGVQLTKQKALIDSLRTQAAELRERDAEARAEISKLHSEKLSMADRIRKIGRERDDYREKAVALRESRTYRVGLAFKAGLTNPARLMRVPFEVRKDRAVKAGARELEAMSSQDQLPPYIEPKRLAPIPNEFVRPGKSQLRVACIMDEFSYSCFSPEGIFLQLSPQNWETELESMRPDLLLVESAWRGQDDQWHNTISQAGKDMRGIIAWCNDEEIPTVFWNKEDPVHYSTFLNVASLFDVVLTTDIDCVPRYKAQLGHSRVHFLPFAAQPRLHNPIEEFERRDAFAFAGAYYAKYPDRAKNLQELAQSLPKIKDLVIFDRMHGQNNLDYKFPPEFRKFIVGSLPPDDISIAYKGYTGGVNLNSVKHSQTMMARRVFELLASNTLVVSNYSPAMQVLFGGLVISSDSGDRAVDLVQRLSKSQYGIERLKAQAVRKVLASHTYEDRMRTICAVSGVKIETVEPSIVVIIDARNVPNIDGVLDSINQQVLQPSQILILVDRANQLKAYEGVTQISDDPSLLNMMAGELLTGYTHCAIMHPSDHYGRHYLEDLFLASRYVSADVVSKAQLSREGDSAKDREYRPASKAPLRSSLIDLQSVSRVRMKSLLNHKTISRSKASRIFLVDRFEYLRDGAQGDSEAKRAVSTDFIEEGFTLAELESRAASAVEGRTIEEREISMESLAHLSRGMNGPVRLLFDGGTARVVSELERGKHAYGYLPATIPIADIGWSGAGSVYVETSPGLELQIAVIFHDQSGSRLGHVMAYPNRNVRFEVPDSAHAVKLAFRATGPGSSVLKHVFTEPHQLATVGLLTRASHIVVTNIYPSYDDLYRNGFVHSRVKAYQETGLNVEVVTLSDVPAPRSREFEGVRVTTMGAHELEKILKLGTLHSVLVHFLDPVMWEVLSRADARVKVHVWVHGAEVQPWWRREYNAESAAELERMKRSSYARLEFWRKVFRMNMSNVDFIFVSRYFADEVFSDVGVRLPSEKYHVIHNPIDSNVFRYIEKPIEQRKRVLSIRPYASRKYANDQAVAAVLALLDEPEFYDMEFLFIGDGPLFDETLKPLESLPNVTIERKFLSHDQIAKVHRNFGVLLTPTRMDAQGVSRDEGMSSGLVPITSNVAAVPEFVDDSSGFLAPAEDYAALARGMLQLVRDPDMFSRMSRAAAERVRSQSEKKKIISKELELIIGKDGQCSESMRPDSQLSTSGGQH